MVPPRSVAARGLPEGCLAVGKGGFEVRSLDGVKPLLTRESLTKAIRDVSNGKYQSAANELRTDFASIRTCTYTTRSAHKHTAHSKQPLTWTRTQHMTASSATDVTHAHTPSPFVCAHTQHRCLLQGGVQAAQHADTKGREARGRVGAI